MTFSFKEYPNFYIRYLSDTKYLYVSYNNKNDRKVYLDFYNYLFSNKNNLTSDLLTSNSSVFPYFEVKTISFRIITESKLLIKFFEANGIEFETQTRNKFKLKNALTFGDSNFKIPQLPDALLDFVKENTSDLDPAGFNRFSQSKWFS